MRKLIILTSVVVFAALAVAEVHQPASEEKESASLVSPQLIKEAGWTRNWQMDLPLKPGETVARMGVIDKCLYAITNTNVLFSIDREKGEVRHASQLGVSQLPICRPLYYDDKFWFIVGSEMLVFDPEFGNFTMKEKFPQIGSSAECGLARNKTHIYISGSDNRIHAINIDGLWQQFTATADNDAPIVSVLATDEIVVFATKAGNVVGMNPNKAEKIWQYDATGQIKGDLVLDEKDGAIYFGSFDSKLYKLGLMDGKLRWKTPFHSGAPIRDSFAVGEDTVYLYNVLNGLYGVDKETGKAVWQIPTGEGFICEKGSKGFVFASPGIVKVMDNKTGKELYSVNFSSVEKYAVNTTDNVMYLSDAKGRLMSVTVK